MQNLSTINATCPVTNGVAIPDTRAMMLEMMIVGRRPYVSDNQPKISISGIAPKKNAVCERAGIQASSHTQSKSVVIDLW